MTHFHFHLFLLTTLSTSFSLSCMDSKSITTPLAESDTSLTNTLINLTPLAKKDIKRYYDKTSEKIVSHEPTNSNHAKNLCKILTYVHHLKQQNPPINEEIMGKFAFNQLPPLAHRIRESISFGKSDDTTVHDGPLYLSVIFARIGQYNKNLEIKKTTSPSFEQFTAHQNNEKNKATAKHAGLTYNLHLDLTALGTYSKAVTDIPKEIALEDFEQLINDIYEIRKDSPDTIETLANILYLNR
jgi:hypothetical protein